MKKITFCLYNKHLIVKSNQNTFCNFVLKYSFIIMIEKSIIIKLLIINKI